jgi:hypothetical protein
MTLWKSMFASDSKAPIPPSIKEKGPASRGLFFAYRNSSNDLFDIAVVSDVFSWCQ